MSQHHLPHPSKTPGSPPVLEAPLDNRSVLGNGALRSKNRFVSLVTLTQARGQGQNCRSAFKSMANRRSLCCKSSSMTLW